MPQSYPSIQSFYKREVPAEKTRPNTTEPEISSRCDDGFNEEELLQAKDPMSRKWSPSREYEESTIDKLVPGPNFVTFHGRVVNFSTIKGSSSVEKKAAGWHNLLLKDNTAAIHIKLYFAPNAYPIKLGQLVSVWTGFISNPSKHEPSNIPGITVYGNLFPGRVTSDHVMIHTSDSASTICRIPLEYRKSQPLSGLMTLSSYLAGGHDGVNGAKILVCVKSIGPLKKIPNKTGGSSDLIEVLLFDHTDEVRFTAWNEIGDNVKDWQPGVTILLISNPGYRVRHNGKGTVGMVRPTMVDVDPQFPDAEWLRKYAMGLTKRESLSLTFPEGVWDVEAAEYGVERIFFTLAELDRWVRSDGNAVFTGFINVMILEMNLYTLHRRNMLMCGEWYIQLYSHYSFLFFTDTFYLAVECQPSLIPHQHPVPIASKLFHFTSTPKSSALYSTKQVVSHLENYSGATEPGSCCLAEV
ncbi:hypothetical protein HYFRA_00007465 [Hymenoscyphus fraxineus]|uniref:Nucleic acid-binding protein n=1 Tax=Hymenoscyphus fraxineus TaxID=746836 RepID=A0A9N9KQC5_9HELO|nr:hypothetical protein HYFRA_00007465 [Hymenoscyphus fraxineus]